METLPVALDNETLQQLENQYHEAIEKIKPQLDKDWLDSLITEDDILDAAAKLTQDD